MHYFYSFLRKSVDLYNEDNTLENNKAFIINAICLSQIILGKDNPQFFDKLNILWMKYLDSLYKGKDVMEFKLMLNKIINSNTIYIYEALSKLSKFQKSGMDSEIYDRKMTWDSYAVEVD